MSPLALRALGLGLAALVAVLLALLIPDATLGTLLAVVIGGGLGAYFFHLADRRQRPR